MNPHPLYNVDPVYTALVRLALEARHYAANGIGKQFLMDAINEAERVTIEACESSTR